MCALPAIDFEREAGAAYVPLPAYRRRKPERTVLHDVVRRHLETFLEEGRYQGESGYPAFVEHEFRRYLDCGQLPRGFARVRCPACGFERLVAFSCKGRLCPSCWARRSADTAAHLVDDVLPLVPYRQWVLTFPWAIRFHLATNPAFLSEMLGAFLGIVFSWQRRRGRALGIADGLTGSVTALQRFGGAMNLNPHIHSAIPDGLFVRGCDDALSFTALPPPTDSDIEILAKRIATRLTRIAQRHLDAHALDPPHVEPDEALAFASAADALRPPGVQGQTGDTQYRHLCARVGGFTLHAGRWAEAHDRQGLERLLRYALRPPFSAERFSLDDEGRVHYQLRKPWPTPDGATEIVLEPLALLRRLAALVPRPYSNLLRYHGLFANRSKARPLLPSPKSDTDEQVPADEPPRPRRVPWAQLLRRVLDIDALSCPRCSTPMLVIAFITSASVLKKILEHLGLPTAPPPLLPPRLWWEEIPVDDQAPGLDENDQVPADIDEQSDDVGTRSPRSPP